MNNKAQAPPYQLTKYPSASFRELIILTFPLILSLISSSLMGFCDRLFLSHHSLLSLQGSVSGGYLAFVFQQATIRITSTSQIFVSSYLGEGKKHLFGETVWQMIWLSLFSMILTIPAGIFTGPLYFAGTDVSETGMTYFKVMMWGNFLYPLAAALSSYFVGQGRMRVIFFCTFFSQILNVILDYFFIFGIEGYLKPMGVFGAALATVIAQSSLCLFFFYFFLKKKEREHHGTGKFALNWEHLLPQLKIGLPRAGVKLCLLADWVAVSSIMTQRGGDYLMVLSIGGTFILFFTFINDGLLQGLLTISSHIIGSRRWDKLRQVLRSSFLFLLGSTLLLAIPYFIFPEKIVQLLISGPIEPAQMQMLKKACLGAWLFFFGYGINTIGLAFVTAARDIKFYFTICFLIWFFSFLPIWFLMTRVNLPPEAFWFLVGTSCALVGITYLIRASSKKWWSQEALDSSPEMI